MNPANPRILTINGGSSSIKFALFEAGDSLGRILEGAIERIAGLIPNLKAEILDPVLCRGYPAKPLVRVHLQRHGSPHGRRHSISLLLQLLAKKALNAR